MNQFKEVKVIMLPTENINKNGIQPFKSKDSLFVPNTGAEASKLSNKAHHLYFFTNEKIGEKDYLYSELSNPTTPAHCISHNFVLDINGKDMLYSDAQSCKNYKIIATTDETMNLPRPSKEFVKKYCEAKEISLVNVEYISKEIPKVAKDGTITIRAIKPTYTREEVISLIGKLQAEGIILPIVEADIFNNWINKNI